jgi:hypothetical protein
MASGIPSSVYNAIETSSDVYVDNVRVGGAHTSGSGLPGSIYAEIPMARSTWSTISLVVSYANTVYYATDKSVFEMPVGGFILMADTFRAPACTKCHSLGSSDAISNFHVSAGAWAAPRPAAQPDTSAQCDSCHGPIAGTGNWFSPSFGRNMNWSGMTMKEVCTAVLSHTPTYSDLSWHIDNDPRLNWSFSNNKLPNGHIEPVPPPYDSGTLDSFAYAMWEPYRALGQPCDGLEWVPY